MTRKKIKNLFYSCVDMARKCDNIARLENIEGRIISVRNAMQGLYDNDLISWDFYSDIDLHYTICKREIEQIQADLLFSDPRNK